MEFGTYLNIPNIVEYDELDENFKYGISVNKNHHKTDQPSYVIYIRTKRDSGKAGKYGRHYASLKVIDKSSGDEDGSPVLIKRTMYHAKHDKKNLDDNDRDFYEDIDNLKIKSLKKYIQNFIFDNQALLIQYYETDDTMEQTKIENELKRRMDVKKYYKGTYEIKSQEKLDNEIAKGI